MTQIQNIHNELLTIQDALSKLPPYQTDSATEQYKQNLYRRFEMLRQQLELAQQQNSVPVYQQPYMINTSNNWATNTIHPYQQSSFQPTVNVTYPQNTNNINGPESHQSFNKRRFMPPIRSSGTLPREAPSYPPSKRYMVGSKYPLVVGPDRIEVEDEDENNIITRNIVMDTTKSVNDIKKSKEVYTIDGLNEALDIFIINGQDNIIPCKYKKKFVLNLVENHGTIENINEIFKQYKPNGEIYGVFSRISSKLKNIIPSIGLVLNHLLLNKVNDMLKYTVKSPYCIDDVVIDLGELEKIIQAKDIVDKERRLYDRIVKVIPNMLSGLTITPTTNSEDTTNAYFNYYEHLILMDKDYFIGSNPDDTIKCLRKDSYPELYNAIKESIVALIGDEAGTFLVKLICFNKTLGTYTTKYSIYESLDGDINYIISSD